MKILVDENIPNSTVGAMKALTPGLCGEAWLSRRRSPSPQLPLT